MYSEVAVRNGSIILVFKCALLPHDTEIGEDLFLHGDFIKDVSYVVDDIDSVIQTVKRYDQEIIRKPEVIQDENGSLIMATIMGSAEGIIHTLIQNIDYEGIFLPHFSPIDNFPICSKFGQIYLKELDHVVEGHPEDTLEDVVQWYDRILQMSRFWSIDDKQIHTQYSALRAALVGNTERNVKMTLVEPVTMNERRMGQVQEFLHYHGGPGIQHIAFKVDDITAVVHNMRERGVEFLDIPESYYDQLELRLANSKIKVQEHLQKIRKLKILIDFDDNGYLLQIFTKPMQDRPTLFVEVIQRHNYNGFGAGNFKALFAAVEQEQKKREVLYS